MASHYKDFGIPFLRSQNILPYRISVDNLVYIDNEFHHHLSKSKLSSGDLAIVRTGYPGTAAVIPKNFPECNCSDLVIVRPGRLVNANYLCAVFNSVYGKDLVGGRLVGAAQQHFNIGEAKELKLNLPPLPIQRKIAAVLSAYDDLIENNNRRIALLEKMGEELYREWFVRLRFPGHESTKIVKGVPEGWTAERFDAVIQTNPSTPIRKGELADRIEMEDVQTGKKFAFGKAGQQIYSGGARFRKGDTIFARITPCLQNGKIAKVNDSIDIAFGSTEFFVFRAIDRVSTSNFVYYLSNSNFVRDTAIASMTGASGRQRADVASVENIIILRPPFALLEKFESMLSPIDRHIQRMLRANQNASESRDRLLTRLMSGKIDLEALDIAFPPSMQEAA